MTDSFLVSATAILRILLIALTGYFLKRFSVLSEEFFSCSHKLVFHGAMPALIFYQIYQMDFEKTANARLFLFCVLALILCYALGMRSGFLLVKDRRKAGAMAQGMTRSTFSIV